MQAQEMFTMNANLVVQCLLVGHEKEKVIIIDNVMSNPQFMVDIIVEEAAFDNHIKEGNYYPGLRMPPPKGYFISLMRVIRPILKDVYNIELSAHMTKAESAISLLTVKPEELSDIQSLPHFDSINPAQFALLHYLCDEKHGGTAFYRHNITGFETITKNRFDEYMNIYFDDLDKRGSPKQEYIRQSNERFTKIGDIDIKYNRLIIYAAASCILPT